ncbi:protein Red-like [Rhopilema esculentum]|uniref:protein Red-like n=1 Tax=Rhopilema esculentum TaxID=499914 RepID=UPI0031E00174
MPMRDDDPYSNPLAPKSHNEVEDDSGNLTNADFRKLLMTPRSTPHVAPPSRPKLPIPKEFDEIEDAATRRRKKKNYYAKLKKQEEEREKELAERYRDRAKERRDGLNPDYQHIDPASTTKTAEYRAVAPTADATSNAAERRRLAIQESKFLGGDMEHTHLVKGLDFALLQKVRSELSELEVPEEEKKEAKDKKEAPKDDIEFISPAGKKIYNAVFNSRVPEKNELFVSGRMAYLFELDDEDPDSDIPTTTIRSKSDCPVLENQSTVTTNDIVINKLTQILSYLRQGVRANKKGKKKDKDGIKGKKGATEESIYGDIGEYEPVPGNKSSGKKEKKSGKAVNYFQKSSSDHAKGDKPPELSVKELVRNVSEKYGNKPSSSWTENQSESRSEKPSKSKSSKKKDAPDSYAECYPGAYEMEDAAGDTDDEADYTKMDLGNKKGPVGRWDFDNEEEYNKYMESREALPKAAFQFGIKMSDGRKTRTKGGHMTEKQKLDREWQQISQIISKRKNADPGRSEGKRRKDE